MSKIWEKYHAESEILAKRLGKIVRKRELLMMTKNDEVAADTLATELRACIEDVLKAQDQLKMIHEDPKELLEMIGVVLGIPEKRREEIRSRIPT